MLIRGAAAAQDSLDKGANFNANVLENDDDEHQHGEWKEDESVQGAKSIRIVIFGVVAYLYI